PLTVTHTHTLHDALPIFDSVENQVQKLGFKIERLNQIKNYRTYDVVGMDCGSCAKSIEKHLSKIPAVNNVDVSFSTGRMKVEHRSEEHTSELQSRFDLVC